MPSVTAKRKCPELIFVRPRFDVYKAVSLQIRDIFAERTPIIEPLSLDEAYLDVTENLKGIASTTQIAEEIRLFHMTPRSGRRIRNFRDGPRVRIHSLQRWDRRGSQKKFLRGTDGSNPTPTGESRANLTSSAQISEKARSQTPALIESFPKMLLQEGQGRPTLNPTSNPRRALRFATPRDAVISLFS
jgi:hypothetical protein